MAKKTKREKNKKINNAANINPVTLDDIKNADNLSNNINDSDINGISGVKKNAGVTANPYKIGDIVLALAGRDGDRLFAVVGIVDKDYVLIANGRSRRIDSPKKKKIKHIKLLKESNEAGNSFAEKVEKSKSGRITNANLRSIITDYAVQAQITAENAETQKNQENPESQISQVSQAGQEKQYGETIKDVANNSNKSTELII